MFQALTTIFFSGAMVAGMGVIVTMLADSDAEIRAALGIAKVVPNAAAPANRRRVKVISASKSPVAAAPMSVAA